MLIVYRIFHTVAGTNVVLDRSIKMVGPLKVRLEQTEYDIVLPPAVAGNRQVVYHSLIGALTFDSSIVFTGLERVYFQFKLG